LVPCAVIVREGGRSSNREALEQNQLRRVLNAPLSRRMTRVFSVNTGRQIPATFITRSASRSAAIQPSDAASGGGHGGEPLRFRGQRGDFRGQPVGR